MDRVHILLDNVSKSYGSIIALKEITLEVHRGKKLSIVGLSGSGKTTLLKLIAGLENPSINEVQVNGAVVKAEDLRKLSTMVFQTSAIFNTTVYNNVAYGLRIRGMSDEEIKNKVEKVLSLVRLDDHVDRNARKLSGGEQQRVSLARAIVIQPTILLLDEPIANLDPANALIIEQAINQLQRNTNLTIVLATHNLDQARRFSNEVAHILNGEIIEKAPTESFFSKPQDIRTKKFVSGELPI